LIRMVGGDVITVRIPRELRDKMRRYDVNWSEVVREAISRRILIEERRKALEAVRRIRERCRPVEEGQLDRWIREDRGR